MRWIVSVKGIVYQGTRVLLARNDRDEWELPGGQLEVGESPRECVEREVLEETGLTVSAGPLVDSYIFEVIPGSSVLILVFGCTRATPEEVARRSDEHTDVRWHDVQELSRIRLPEGYRAAIDEWPPPR